MSAIPRALERDDAAGRAERGGPFQLRLGARDGHHAAAGRAIASAMARPRPRPAPVTM
jgi:hypothetical protein